MKDESFAIVFNVKQYFFQSSADWAISVFFSDEPENRHWTGNLFGEVMASPDG